MTQKKLKPRKYFFSLLFTKTKSLFEKKAIPRFSEWKKRICRRISGCSPRIFYVFQSEIRREIFPESWGSKRKSRSEKAVWASIDPHRKRGKEIKGNGWSHVRRIRSLIRSQFHGIRLSERKEGFAWATPTFSHKRRERVREGQKGEKSMESIR